MGSPGLQTGFANYDSLLKIPMKSEKVPTYDSQPSVFSRWIRIIFLLLLIAGVIYLFFNLSQCIDGCGPYHNTTSVADLDEDGDLDVVLSSLRHESQTIFWAGSTSWINQGGGKFAPRGEHFGGPSTTAGDLDGDGDADIVGMAYTAKIHLNQGGEQGGKPGDFKEWHSITPQEDVHTWSTPGFVVLGDLNNDGRLDAMMSYCCSMLIDKRDGILPFLPYVWIDPPGGRILTRGWNLTSMGDLPMRPTLGDLDGDGDLDVYVASLPPRGARYDSADRVFLNDGSGNFVDSGQRLQNPRLAGAAGSGSVALADLDGDGDLDALVATSSGAVIWINQGAAQGGQAGVFADSGQRLDRLPVEDVFLADLDADGDADAVVGGKAFASVWLDSVTSAGKAQASIWLNEGQAGFRDSGQRLRYDERHGLAIGDFNGDGHLDVFSAAGGIEFHLWINQGDGRLQEGN